MVKATTSRMSTEAPLKQPDPKHTEAVPYIKDNKVMIKGGKTQTMKQTDM